MRQSQIITTELAPAPVGPYSQAVVEGGIVYVSGQVALMPGPDKILANDTITAETGQVLDNLRAVLGAAGLDFNHVRRAGIYVTDSSYFGEVNAAYSTRFPDGRFPARTTLVSGIPLQGAHVEIDMIAAMPLSTRVRRFIRHAGDLLLSRQTRRRAGKL